MKTRTSSPAARFARTTCVAAHCAIAVVLGSGRGQGTYKLLLTRLGALVDYESREDMKAGDELTFRCTIVDKEPQKAVITKPKEDTRIGLTLWSREETDPPLVTEIHPEGAAAGKVEVGDTLVRLSGPHRIKVVEVAGGGGLVVIIPADLKGGGVRGGGGEGA